jgi:hypothetical protein
MVLAKVSGNRAENLVWRQRKKTHPSTKMRRLSKCLRKTHMMHIYRNMQNSLYTNRKTSSPAGAAYYVSFFARIKEARLKVQGRARQKVTKTAHKNVKIRTNQREKG